MADCRYGFLWIAVLQRALTHLLCLRLSLLEFLFLYFWSQLSFQHFSMCSFGQVEDVESSSNNGHAGG